jgi:hypothetical protein
MDASSKKNEKSESALTDVVAESMLSSDDEAARRDRDTKHGRRAPCRRTPGDGDNENEVVNSGINENELVNFGIAIMANAAEARRTAGLGRLRRNIIMVV